MQKQKGMSFIGFLLILSMVLFIAYLGMRVAPIYLEYYSVVSAMNGVAEERGSSRLSLFDIRVKVLDRLYVSYSDAHVKSDNIRLIRKDGVQLQVAYETRKKLIGNLDVIATFDRMVPLAN